MSDESRRRRRAKVLAAASVGLMGVKTLSRFWKRGPPPEFYSSETWQKGSAVKSHHIWNTGLLTLGDEDRNAQVFEKTTFAEEFGRKYLK